MANLPNKVQKFRDHEKDFGTSIAEALWKQAIQTANYIDKSYPVGMILFFHATQSNLPALPDSNYWKELDGSTVSNANSPMNGVVLPDFRDKFFRHPKTGEILLSSSGSNTITAPHNHGSHTGTTDNRGDFNMDDGGERQEAAPHRHAISTSLSSPITIIPQYIALKLYVRIV